MCQDLNKIPEEGDKQEDGGLLACHSDTSTDHDSCLSAVHDASKTPLELRSRRCIMWARHLIRHTWGSGVARSWS